MFLFSSVGIMLPQLKLEHFRHPKLKKKSFVLLVEYQCSCITPGILNCSTDLNVDSPYNELCIGNKRKSITLVTFSLG